MSKKKGGGGSGIGSLIFLLLAMWGIWSLMLGRPAWEVFQ